ncbi:MAG: hypothetical protein IJU76_15255 [Desulfovibrionaceae bacterium]|nr:hypothetical protein [Desulfovibrionaceae bacterium]
MPGTLFEDNFFFFLPDRLWHSFFFAKFLVTNGLTFSLNMLAKQHAKSNSAKLLSSAATSRDPDGSLGSSRFL